VTCSYPSRTLPVRLMESFASLPDDVSWSHINGGTITTRCGVIAVGTAMHMKGVSVGRHVISQCRFGVSHQTKVNRTFV